MSLALWLNRSRQAPPRTNATAVAIPIGLTVLKFISFIFTSCQYFGGLKIEYFRFYAHIFVLFNFNILLFANFIGVLGRTHKKVCLSAYKHACSSDACVRACVCVYVNVLYELSDIGSSLGRWWRQC